MKRPILTLVALLLVSPTLLTASHETVQKRSGDGVLVVVDRSGSMYGMMGLIRQQVGGLMARLGRDLPTGLIHFSGCGPEHIVYDPPLAAGNADRVNAALAGVEASGMTDLAGALRKARQAMEETGLCPQLALFTDQYDTCGGDPNTIIGDDFCLEINVITSTTEMEVIEKLEALSEKSNGRTFFAETDEEVADALDRIAKKAAVRKKARSRIQASQGKDQTGNSSVGNPDGEDGGKGKKPKKKAPLRNRAEQEDEKEKEGN